jgi:hypothetical protein
VFQYRAFYAYANELSVLQSACLKLFFKNWLCCIVDKDNLIKIIVVFVILVLKV